MSLGRKLIRNTLWNVVDTILDTVIPPIVAAIVARTLGPDNLGAFSYVMWIASLAVMFGVFGAGSAVQKYLGECIAKNDFATGKSVVRLALRMQAIVGTVVVGGAMVWVYSLRPEQRTYAAIAVSSVFPMALMSVASAVNASLENLAPNVKSSIVGMLVQNVLTLLTLAMGWGMLGLSASLCIGRWVDCIIRLTFASQLFAAYAREHGGGAHTPFGTIPDGMRRSLVAFCFQATGLMLLNLAVWNRSEIIFLERLCHPREVAYFSVAFSFSALPGSIAQPFARAAVASLFAERGKSLERGLMVAQLVSRYQFLIVSPVAAGLAALSSPLVQVFYGDQYLPSIPVFFVAVLLGVAGPLVRPAIDILTASDLQRPLLWWTGCASVIVLTLDWLLVSEFCSMGGAWANGAGQVAFAAGTWIIARRLVGLKLPLWFGAKVVLVSAAMGAVVMLSAVQLNPLVALIAGPPLGVSVFALGLRLLCVLDKQDRDRLLAAADTLPASLRPYLTGVTAWLCRVR